MGTEKKPPDPRLAMPPSAPKLPLPRSFAATVSTPKRNLFEKKAPMDLAGYHNGPPTAISAPWVGSRRSAQGAPIATAPVAHQGGLGNRTRAMKLAGVVRVGAKDQTGLSMPGKPARQPLVPVIDSRFPVREQPGRAIAGTDRVAGVRTSGRSINLHDETGCRLMQSESQLESTMVAESDRSENVQGIVQQDASNASFEHIQYRLAFLKQQKDAFDISIEELNEESLLLEMIANDNGFDASNFQRDNLSNPHCIDGTESQRELNEDENMCDDASGGVATEIENSEMGVGTPLNWNHSDEGLVEVFSHWASKHELEGNAKVEAMNVIGDSLRSIYDGSPIEGNAMEWIIEDWADRYELNNFIKKDLTSFVCSLSAQPHDKIASWLNKEGVLKSNPLFEEAGMKEGNAPESRNEKEENNHEGGKHDKVLKVLATIDEDELRVSEDWWNHHAVIAHIQGPRPSRDFLLGWVRNAWTRRGMVVTNIRLLRNGYFLAVFETPNMVDLVLNQGLWTIRNQPMYLDRWRRGFSPDNPRPTTAPVWVELTDLPFPFYDQLERLCANLGRVICVEKEQEFSPRGSPTVCVMMDLAKDMPGMLTILAKDGRVLFDQPIVYKNLPNSCFFCGGANHSIKYCPARRAYGPPKKAPFKAAQPNKRDMQWVPKANQEGVGNVTVKDSKGKDVNSKDKERGGDLFTSSKKSASPLKKMPSVNEAVDLHVVNRFAALEVDENMEGFNSDVDESVSGEGETVPDSRAEGMNEEMHVEDTGNRAEGEGRSAAIEIQPPPSTTKKYSKRQRPVEVRQSLVNLSPGSKRSGGDVVAKYNDLFFNDEQLTVLRNEVLKVDFAKEDEEKAEVKETPLPNE